MSEWAKQLLADISGGTISTSSMEALGDCTGFTPATGSAAWPVANKALLIPFRLVVPFTVKQISWFNGSVVSGNVDAGVYDIAGNRLVSIGSTAQSGTSTIQAVTCTTTPLAPGYYFMALAADNTTATMTRFGSIGVTILEAHGMQEMAAAFALPSTITFANPASAYVPWMSLHSASVA